MRVILEFTQLIYKKSDQGTQWYVACVTYVDWFPHLCERITCCQRLEDLGQCKRHIFFPTGFHYVLYAIFLLIRLNFCTHFELGDRIYGKYERFTTSFLLHLLLRLHDRPYATGNNLPRCVFLVVTLLVKTKKNTLLVSTYSWRALSKVHTGYTKIEKQVDACNLWIRD